MASFFGCFFCSLSTILPTMAGRQRQETAPGNSCKNLSYGPDFVLIGRSLGVFQKLPLQFSRDFVRFRLWAILKFITREEPCFADRPLPQRTFEFLAPWAGGGERAPVFTRPPSRAETRPSPSARSHLYYFSLKRVGSNDRSPAAGSLHRAGCEDERSSSTGPAQFLHRAGVRARWGCRRQARPITFRNCAPKTPSPSPYAFRYPFSNASPLSANRRWCSRPAAPGK